MVFYCTVEDIETQLSTPILIQLSSDDEGQDEIDRNVVDEAILYSSTLIDGYLRGRYTLPLNTHFPLLRILCIGIFKKVLFLYKPRVKKHRKLQVLIPMNIAQIKTNWTGCSESRS